MDGPLNWFAVRVRPRAERVVADALLAKGYEQFLPLHLERRRWSDRVTSVEMPLFPGYVFCRFDVRQRLPILTTPGVILLVGVGKTPLPIDDEEIASLRVLVASRLQLQAWPCLHVGERVQIVGGPLAGAHGILLRIKSEQRLVVSITLLQRSVAVEIPESCAWPAAPERTSQAMLAALARAPSSPPLRMYASARHVGRRAG
jgi:transcription antitermination factor NusG